MFQLLVETPLDAGPPIMPTGETPYSPNGEIKSKFDLGWFAWNVSADLQSPLFNAGVFQAENARDFEAEEFWLKQYSEEWWRDRLKWRLEDTIAAINEFDKIASSYFAEFTLSLNYVLSGAVGAFSVIAGFASRPIQPTFEELEGLAIYADQWATVVGAARKATLDFKKSLDDIVKSSKVFKEQAVYIVAKIGESYEATIGALNEKITRLEAFIDQLVEENKRLYDENARLKKELSKWKIDLTLPKIPDASDFDFSGIKKVAKYAAYGFGGLILLQALGFAKNLTKIFSR